MRLRNIPGAREEIEASPYVIGNPIQYRDRWRETFFQGKPLHLEIGMGKGRFIMEMAESRPEIGFLGMEMYSSVLLRAVQKRHEREAEHRTYPNLYFLREDARLLPEMFAPGEIDMIWLNFSDPWPKERHADRRLTSRRFLARYEQVLAPGGTVEFKTDNRELFDFSLEEAAAAGWEITVCTKDLHRDPQLMRENIMTEYEEKFAAMGKPICRLRMTRKPGGS